MTDETTPGTEVAERREFVLVSSGERVPATRDNAAAVILAARERKRGLDEIIRDAEGWLAEESRTMGTKTFHTDYGKVELSGGETTEYDPEVLMEALREAECPEERIAEAVVETVTRRVDKRVLRQLAGANEKYAAAAEKAATKIETPLKASVSAPRTRR